MLRAVASGAGGGSGGNTASIQPPLTKTSYDTITGTGLLQGSTTDSGGQWELSGPGAATATKNAGGYATATQNTYCFLQAAPVVQRVVTRFQGNSDCTLAICQDTTLQNMVHVNIGPNADADIKLWVGGVADQSPAFVADCNVTPNTADNQPHEYAIEVSNNYCYAFCDGILITVAYDQRFGTVVGQYAFAQLHGTADERLYSLELYTPLQPRKLASAAASLIPDLFLDRAPVATSSLQVGPHNQFPIAPVDFSVESAVIRSSAALDFKVMSADGFVTTMHFGAGDPTGNGPVRFAYNPATFGLDLFVGSNLAAQFPDLDIGPRAMLTPEIQLGTTSNQGPAIVWGAADPIAQNFPAPIGSLYLRTNGSVYRKSGAADNAWTLMS